MCGMPIEDKGMSRDGIHAELWRNGVCRFHFDSDVPSACIRLHRSDGEGLAIQGGARKRE